MSMVYEQICNTPIPKMAKVRQRFYSNSLTDYKTTLQEQLDCQAIRKGIHSGMRIAVAVGSRNIHGIKEIVRVVVDFLKAQGSSPFIVPAMGAHGGATAQGQLEILAGLGITEEAMQVPIRADMDVVQVGTVDGAPVMLDSQAAAADGIVLINRIKPHPNFSGAHESGLLNMLTVGLGNLHGAKYMHSTRLERFSERIASISTCVMEQRSVLFGVAVIENAVNTISDIHVIPCEEIVQRDEELLQIARGRIPRVMYDDVDLIILDRIGRDISGNGFDPNVTGQPQYFVFLDLSDQSCGAAPGIGEGHVITKRLFQKIDLETTYQNIIVTNYPYYSRIPMMMDNDRLAMQAALKMLLEVDRDNLRVVRIHDTLNVDEIWVSEAMLAESDSRIEVLGEPTQMNFDPMGNLYL